MIEKDAINNIKRKLYAGLLSYEEAKVEAAPFIKALNKRASTIAKKHGQRPPCFNFATMIR